MKKLLACLILTLSLSGCYKNGDSNVVRSLANDALTPLFKPDYFLFGGIIPCMCNSIHSAYYFLHADSLYLDGLDTEKLTFPTSHRLADSFYAFAKPLVTTFPQYLLNHPNTTIGCDTCGYVAPIGGITMINIVAVTGTDTIRWNVSTDTASLPADIKQYMALMNNVFLKDLKP